MLVQGDFSEYLYNGEILNFSNFSAPNNRAFVLQNFDVMHSQVGSYTLLQFGTNSGTFSTLPVLDSINGQVTIPLITASASRSMASYSPTKLTGEIISAQIVNNSLGSVPTRTTERDAYVAATATYTKSLYE